MESTSFGFRDDSGKKTPIAVGLLVVFALWPLVHHLLVEAHGMNQWKLGGWAMYTKPPPYVDVGIYSPDGHHQIPLEAVGREVPGGDRALTEFFVRRRLWGDFEGPESLARTIMDHWSRLEGLRVYVTTVDRFQAASRQERYRTDVYDCGRSAGSVRCERPLIAARGSQMAR